MKILYLLRFIYTVYTFPFLMSAPEKTIRFTFITCVCRRSMINSSVIVGTRPRLTDRISLTNYKDFAKTLAFVCCYWKTQRINSMNLSNAVIDSICSIKPAHLKNFWENKCLLQIPGEYSLRLKKNTYLLNLIVLNYGWKYKNI